MAADGDGPMGPTRMRLSKPVIAAVAGHAVAGGLELALWCDLRVAEEDAVLGVFCRRWGVPLIDGGTVRLPRLIGVSRAMDMVLTGRGVGADEALAMGLVNRVVPVGASRAAAEELAQRLAEFPQTCMREDRLSLLEQDGMDEAAALAQRAPARDAVAAGGSGRASSASARARGATGLSTAERRLRGPGEQLGARGRRVRPTAGSVASSRVGACPGLRPVGAARVVGVVDPRQGPVGAGVGVDPRELPVGRRRTADAVEGNQRQRSRKPQREREIVVGLLLPTRAPHELELVREREQAVPRRGREEMGDSVDQLEAAGGRIGGVEAEQRDHSVDIDQ